MLGGFSTQYGPQSFAPSSALPPKSFLEWDSVISEIKAKYLGRDFKRCAKRCIDLLEQTSEEIHPVYECYLNYFAGLCYECIGRATPLHSRMKNLWLEKAVKYYNRARCTLPEPVKPDVVLAAPEDSLPSLSADGPVPGLLPQSAIKALYEYGCGHESSNAIAPTTSTQEIGRVTSPDDNPDQEEAAEVKTNAIFASRSTYCRPKSAEIPEPAVRDKNFDNERRNGFLPTSAVAELFAVGSKFARSHSITPPEHAESPVQQDLEDLFAVLLAHNNEVDDPNTTSQSAFPESFITPQDFAIKDPVVLKNIEDCSLQENLAQPVVASLDQPSSDAKDNSGPKDGSSHLPEMSPDIDPVIEYLKLTPDASTESVPVSEKRPSTDVPAKNPFDGMTLVIDKLLDHFEDPFVSLDRDVDSKSEFMKKILSCLPLHLRLARTYHQNLQRKKPWILFDKDLLPDPLRITSNFSGLGPPGEDVPWDLIDLSPDYSYKPFMFQGFNDVEESPVQEDSGIDDQSRQEQSPGQRVPALSNTPGSSDYENYDHMGYVSSSDQGGGALRSCLEVGHYSTEYSLFGSRLRRFMSEGGGGNASERMADADASSGNGNHAEFFRGRNLSQDISILKESGNNDQFARAHGQYSGSDDRSVEDNTTENIQRPFLEPGHYFDILKSNSSANDVAAVPEPAEDSKLGESAYYADDEQSILELTRPSERPCEMFVFYFCQNCDLVVRNCPHSVDSVETRKILKVPMDICKTCQVMVRPSHQCPTSFGPDEFPDPLTQSPSNHPIVRAPLGEINVCETCGGLNDLCSHSEVPSTGTSSPDISNFGSGEPVTREILVGKRDKPVVADSGWIETPGRGRAVEEAIQFIREMKSPSTGICLQCFLRGDPSDHPDNNCLAENAVCIKCEVKNCWCFQEMEIDKCYTRLLQRYDPFAKSLTSQKSPVPKSGDMKSSQKSIIKSSKPAERNAGRSALAVEKSNMNIFSLQHQIESNILSIDKMIKDVITLQKAHKMRQLERSALPPGAEGEPEPELDMDETGIIFLKETKAQRIKRLRADNWSKVTIPWKGPEYYQKFCDIVMKELDERKEI